MVRLRFFKMGRGVTGVNLESNCIDIWLAGDHASCYGVNLAFAGFGGCCFFLASPIFDRMTAQKEEQKQEQPQE